MKDERQNRVFISKEKTADALCIETEYEPLEVYQDVTLLQVHLITGRSHQIRAHLASIGHPIIGDSKYGNEKSIILPGTHRRKTSAFTCLPDDICRWQMCRSSSTG